MRTNLIEPLRLCLDLKYLGEDVRERKKREKVEGNKK